MNSFLYPLMASDVKEKWQRFRSSMLPYREVLGAPEVINKILLSTGKHAIIIGIDEAMAYENASSKSIYHEALRNIVNMNSSTRLVFVLTSFLNAYRLAVAVQGKALIPDTSRKAAIIPLPRLSVTCDELLQLIKNDSRFTDQVRPAIRARTRELQGLKPAPRQVPLISADEESSVLCVLTGMDVLCGTKTWTTFKLLSDQEEAAFRWVWTNTSGHARSVARLAAAVVQELLSRIHPAQGKLLDKQILVRLSLACESWSSHS